MSTFDDLRLRPGAHRNFFGYFRVVATYTVRAVGFVAASMMVIAFVLLLFAAGF